MSNQLGLCETMMMFYVNKASHIRSSVHARDAVLVDYPTESGMFSYNCFSYRVNRATFSPKSEFYPFSNRSSYLTNPSQSARNQLT